VIRRSWREDLLRGMKNDDGAPSRGMGLRYERMLKHSNKFLLVDRIYDASIT